MRRFITSITLFFVMVILNSCLTKTGLPKNLCQIDEFLKDISHYTKSELAKLARVLESSSAAHSGNSGCRAALLGQVYLAQEHMSKASDYFSLAARQLPEINEYFLLAKANAEIRNQNLDHASKITNALLSSHASMLSPQFSLRIRQVLADIAVQKKDDQQIIKTHRDLLEKGFTENEALLFNLAAALTNVGEHKKANEVYKRLLIHFPISPGAKHAERLQNLAHYNLNLKEIEKRFDKLIEKLAFDQVVKDADFLIKKSSMDKESKGQIKGFAVKSLVLNNKFEAGLTRSRHMTTRRNVNANELENHAWALAKIGRYIEAAEFYGKFIKVAKNKEDRARACFFQGFSLYEANLYSMAMFAWQSCYAFAKDSEYYENYLWYQALASILNENYHKAFGMLNDQRKLFPKSSEKEKYTYFLGYTLHQLNKKTEGDLLFRELSKKAQPSYYVLLAQQTLGLHHYQGIDIPPDALLKLVHKTKDIDCKNALVLFHLGFKDEARDVILRSTAHKNDKLAMLQYIGFYHDAWRKSYLLNSSLVIDGSSLKADPSIRATFPLPHRNIVDEISEKYSVNKSLLYAIIREESGFLEKVISNRGAVGLMQMMPFVATDLADRLAIQEFSSEHLKNPKISIELGALFVAILQRQFNNPHLVVAAYNAGPHQVQKWLDRFGHLPTELFVERIPFKQTRDYVKKVLPSESLYHALNGQKLRLAF
jgi:soluble lytic murein transglycosylase